ncbi:MAG: hypothetical protein ACRDST_16320 [Pseudonocardiaceae bacterium]
MIDVPEAQHQRTERGRVAVQGRRTDDRSRCTLLLIHETDGSWSFHGLGAPGVNVTMADAVAVAGALLPARR